MIAWSKKAREAALLARRSKARLTSIAGKQSLLYHGATRTFRTLRTDGGVAYATIGPRLAVKYAKMKANYANKPPRLAILRPTRAMLKSYNYAKRSMKEHGSNGSTVQSPEDVSVLASIKLLSKARPMQYRH